MKRRDGLLAALGVSAAVCGPLALAQAPPPAPTPAPRVGDLKSLGQERYQVGRIVVDKRARSFSVPGRVHLLDKPLEYLATSPGGRKAYEALLELDATGTEFNIACLLVGLERDPDLPASKPPFKAAATGPRVTLSVAWSEGGQRRQISAAQALLNAQAGAKMDAIEWAYTGSFSSIDGSQFAADRTGNLISLINDPTGIIEAVGGIGVGAYGSVRGHAMLPPVGTPIELIVDAANAAK